MLAEAESNIIHFYRFEEQKYAHKAAYELGDKENRVVNIDSNDERVLILLNSAVMLLGKGKFDSMK